MYSFFIRRAKNVKTVIADCRERRMKRALSYGARPDEQVNSGVAGGQKALVTTLPDTKKS
jgi:hypothetical protein